MDNAESYTIKEVSARLDVPTWKIRRLCRGGMVPYVRRDQTRHFVFDAGQVEMVRMLIDLERAGMPRKSLKRLVGLMRKGDTTLKEQKAMLETCRQQFWQELKDLQRGIDMIERKIEVIDEKIM